LPERHLITSEEETEAAIAAMRPEAAGFVLAGGRSSRMGADKALARFAGRPLIGHAVDLLKAAGLPAAIAGARSPLQDFAPVVEDAWPDQGPLGGICAALNSTAARWVVFLSVDLPLMPASLPAYMLHHARITGAPVTVPSVSGFAQTFPAVIDRATLPALEREFAAGRGGCFAAFQAAASALGQAVSVVPVELLVQAGQLSHPGALPAARWFLNVNSPADLDRAEAYNRRPIA
jgi:molybdopterin-guanine dinucleotide biosynthesis protein A